MTDLSSNPFSAYASEKQCAERLGRSLPWFRANRSKLEREGFPRRDALIGLTLRADIEAWLARRRKVADAGAVQQDADTTSTTTKVRYDAI